MSLDPAVHLRLLLAEAIPEGGSDADTFFTDETLTELLATADDSVNTAAYIGWTMKLAHYAHYYDISESGSVRHLSQRYGNALQMVKHWKAVFDQEVADAAFSTRIVGVVAKVYGDACVPTTLINEFMGEEPLYRRAYPTKRMRSILG